MDGVIAGQSDIGCLCMAYQPNVLFSPMLPAYLLGYQMHRWAASSCGIYIKSINQRHLEDVFKGVSFFLPAYIVCVLILMIFPEIITFLPNLMK